MVKQITILGSTGTIGLNALRVLEKLKEEFTITGLSANKNGIRLVQQAKQWFPEAVAIVDPEAFDVVNNGLKNTSIEILHGREGLLELARRSHTDILLNGLVGSSGMEPTLNAIQSGVHVALSNKESLVMAGDLINREKQKTKANIYPVDSEHSAIWQCLAGEKMDDVKSLILTGSGGPFRTRPIETFGTITPKEALNHPNWEMGEKITIDSASMMNKGLEVIEARWLFDVKSSQIEIVVHPESIIHSMVEFKDGSVKAQLGVPDMKVPIQYALTFPNHKNADWEKLDLIKIGKLNFEAPDYKRFPCIQLAYDALKQGGTTPAVLNVANEQAVYRFLRGKIDFLDIPAIIETACDKHDWIEHPHLEDLLQLETWTTTFVNHYKIR